MSSSCSLCTDIQGECRVNLPRINTMHTKGGECSIDTDVIGDIGSKTYVTPYNVVYQRPGVTIREFNPQSLRLPQKRTFLGPDFFNSGCVGLYGNSRWESGPSSAEEDAANSATRMMYDYSFQTRPYFEGNNVDCATAGAKCAGPNSALGWMLNPAGMPFWMEQNKANVTAVCQAQKQ